MKIIMRNVQSLPAMTALWWCFLSFAWLGSFVIDASLLDPANAEVQRAEDDVTLQHDRSFKSRHLRSSLQDRRTTDMGPGSVLGRQRKPGNLLNQHGGDLGSKLGFQQQQTTVERGSDTNTKDNKPVALPEKRIVGGTSSAQGDFPYFVDLSGCGGSLIAPQVVLTAAHCNSVAGLVAQVARVGAYDYSWNSNDGSIIYDIAETVMNPRYNSITVANDFLLIRLAEPVDIDDTLPNALLQLSTSTTDHAPDTPLTVLGLGLTSQQGSFPTNLRDVEVKAWSDDNCANSYSIRGEAVDEDVMFCAGFPEGGKDSCQGDSGGPIVRVDDNGIHTQVGVVSWGYGCALEGLPGVYADVVSAMSWIRGVVCNTNTGWGLSAPFCIDEIPTAAPVPPPTVTPDRSTRAFSAQYLLYMEHYTDDISSLGVANSPGPNPLVRYMCRGGFQAILTHNDLGSNPDLSCTDVIDDEGFSGKECRHTCDDCSYWWNNDVTSISEYWRRAGVWFECSGDSQEDLEAKFVWVNEGPVELDLPLGVQATNAKIARLAVRSDYTETNEELIDRGVFPPTDSTSIYVSVANTDPFDEDAPVNNVYLSANGALDGGYFAWTGVSLCSASCTINFGDLVLRSKPSTFPESHFRSSGQ